MSTVRVRRSPWRQLLVLWVLGLGIIDLWRGWVLWDKRALLIELGSSLSPGVLRSLVVLFTTCGMGLIVSAGALWWRRRWASVSTRVFILLYFALVQAYTWLFVRSGLMWERRWVSLIAAGAAIGLSMTILTWRRSRQWLGLP